MTTEMRFPELERGRRDALLAWVIHHHPLSKTYGISSAEDLYEFMLVDPLVGENVETSDVVMASAGLRQYVHAILGGMEPGYAGVYRGEADRDWRDRRSEYALWAGHQTLANYPENYIEPPLRLGQTQAFKDFVNETNQGRITKDGVQVALMNYLHKFEATCNLKIVAGYCASLDARNADYYFIGSNPKGDYFWRRLSMRLGDAGTKVPPTAWSEWRPVSIPSVQGRVVKIRPVWFNERLYVAWLEYQDLPVDESGDGRTTRQWTLSLSWLGLSDAWAAPLQWVLSFRNGSKGWVEPKNVTFVVTANNDAVNHRKLFIGAFGEGVESPVTFLFDEFLKELPEGALVDRERFVKTYIERDRIVQVASLMVPSITYAKTVGGQVVHWSHDLGVSLSFAGSDATGSKMRVVYEGHGAAWEDSQMPIEVLYQIVFDDGHISSWNRGGSGYYFSYAIEVEYPVTVGTRFEARVELTSRWGKSWSSAIYEIESISPSVPDVITLDDGGQFLDLRVINPGGDTHVRLNTLFGRYLLDRVSVSVGALLDWGVQIHPESPVPDGASGVSETLDFNGANGRYFWELFFHVAHHVAWRLHQDMDYAQAEEWLKYIFNPMARARAGSTNPRSYWGVKALLEDGSESHELAGPADPDAICYSSPVHYRKAIFIAYVRNLLAWGDRLYRRLTRDALNEAKLLYVRALSLMGPKPDNRMIGRWTPVSLGEAASYDSSTFAEFESEAAMASLPYVIESEGIPWLDLLDATHFRLPLNSELLSVWKDIDLRLENLRSNLTLDGKPLTIPLYDPPANPKDILRAQNDAGGLGQRGAGGLAIIPAYRFRAMLPRAQAAADTLARFGDQVLAIRERKDRAHLDELLQAQVQELSEFSTEIQALVDEQCAGNIKALEASRRKVEVTQAYFERLIAVDVSANEKRAAQDYLISSGTRTAANALLTTGGAFNAAAFVGGMAFGLVAPGAAFTAAGMVSQLVADSMVAEADDLMRADGFQRRRMEWIHQRDVAESEVAAIDKQLDVLKKAREQSARQLDMAKMASKHAAAHYTFLKTRSTSEGLYQWLLGQMSTYYFQAYDAVVSLCLSTEAAWRYEMGDYQARFIQPDVWSDAYHGLLAGEPLKLQLIRMESAYLKRNERRFELSRFVSLVKLFDSAKEQGRDARDGAAALAELRTKGELAFELPSSLFDHDYPGHYLRQISSVSVSLAIDLDPLDNVKAILTQTSSVTVLKADDLAMNYLYDKKGDGTSTANIVFNPRAAQSIGLSHGMDDLGMHQLLFLDDRYLPFEGTGAVSKWTLHFPRHDRAPQKALLTSLKDVVLRVQYTAVDGGFQFADKVVRLVDEVIGKGG